MGNFQSKPGTSEKPEKEQMKIQEAFWLTIFNGTIPVLDLPLDFARPEVQRFSGDVVKFTIEAEATEFLRGFAAEAQTTLFIVVLALGNIWLSKICNQETVVIGTGAACRRHPDIQYMAGNFQNMLALVNYPGMEKTVGQFLTEVKERAVDSFANQEYPFEELVKKIALKREQGRSPLFDVFFLLQEAGPETPGPPGEPMQGLRVKPAVYQSQRIRFDLALYGFDRGERLHFHLEYNTGLFKDETAAEFARYFKDIIDVVKDNPQLKLKDIKISQPLLETKNVFTPADYRDFNF